MITKLWPSWPGTYTHTLREARPLHEQLQIQGSSPNLELKTSVFFPFAGWNQGNFFMSSGRYIRPCPPVLESRQATCCPGRPSTSVPCPDGCELLLPWPGVGEARALPPEVVRGPCTHLAAEASKLVVVSSPASPGPTRQRGSPAVDQEENQMGFSQHDTWSSPSV